MRYHISQVAKLREGTHRYKLGDNEAADDSFAKQRDGVIKIAITP